MIKQMKHRLLEKHTVEGIRLMFAYAFVCGVCLLAEILLAVGNFKHSDSLSRAGFFFVIVMFYIGLYIELKCASRAEFLAYCALTGFATILGCMRILLPVDMFYAITNKYRVLIYGTGIVIIASYIFFMVARMRHEIPFTP